MNSTKYSLEDIEINNAVYSGAMKVFAQSFADRPIFSGVGSNRSPSHDVNLGVLMTFKNSAFIASAMPSVGVTSK